MCAIVVHKELVDIFLSSHCCWFYKMGPLYGILHMNNFLASLGFCTIGPIYIYIYNTSGNPCLQGTARH